MSTAECPDLEQLFIGLDEGRPETLSHIDACPACSGIVEEHRQLEKDLLRISDPLPPPDFVHLVMAKVEAAPVPVRREIWSGISILLAAMGGIAAVLLTDSGSASMFGAAVASALLSLKSFVAAAGPAFTTIWATSALPLTVFASFVLATVLLGLRKLIGAPQDQRVTA